jgi:hypothetical protein
LRIATGCMRDGQLKSGRAEQKTARTTGDGVGVGDRREESEVELAGRLAAVEGEAYLRSGGEGAGDGERGESLDWELRVRRRAAGDEGRWREGR